MELLLKLVALLHHIIWIFIGLAIIVGAIAVFRVGPTNIIQTLVGHAALSNSSSAVTDSQWDCITQDLGANRANQIKTQGAVPTAAEQAKIAPCFE